MFDSLLREDILFGDITSELIVPKDLTAQAHIIAQEDCVIAGLQYLNDKITHFGLTLQILINDGNEAKKNSTIAVIEGNAQKILQIERVFLNILSRMSGIATATRRIVNKVSVLNPKVRIASTRKTLWGYLDKIAVKIGGGDPHRWNLGDHILIKDNHISLIGLENALSKINDASFVRKIEVEVESIQDALKAVTLRADIVMLDNFTPQEIKKTVKLLTQKGLRRNVILEASGKITEDNIQQYVKSGIDVISIGSLTHSVKSIDLSMEFLPHTETTNT